MREITIELPSSDRGSALACGADMKGAFAFAKGKRLVLVYGFGDLQELDNYSRYERTINERMRQLAPGPGTIACDLHPGYSSTRLAEELLSSRRRARIVRVQHHEAHIAGCMAEHRIRGEVIGVAFDGTGYGLDGKIWGGEFFAGSAEGFRRAAHFDYLPMPGADAAVREPWRMAASCLYRAYGDGFLRLKIGAVERMGAGAWRVLRRMIDRRINAPLSSSVGRLFDAAAALVLSKDTVTQEAEGPIALEKIADRSWRGSYECRLRRERGMYIIDPSPCIKALVADIRRKKSPEALSAQFHNTIAEVIVSVCMRVKRSCRTKRVVLSGGVFQNAFLRERATELLGRAGFEVYANLKVPINDHGIAAGQLAIARARA